MRSIFLVVAILGIFSCRRQPVIFKNGKALEVEKIKIDPLFDGYYLNMDRHFLYVQSDKTDSLLFMYRLPDLKYVKSSGVKGRGPNEFHILKFVYGGYGNLYLSGYSNPFLINEFKVDSSGGMTLVKSFDCRNARHTIFNQMHIVKDSLLIYNACAFGLGIRKYDLVNHSDLDGIAFEEDHKEIPTCNSNWGVVAANDSVIAYAYSNKRQIDFYDVNSLKLIKQVEGEYDYVKPQDPRTDINYYSMLV